MHGRTVLGVWLVIMALVSAPSAAPPVIPFEDRKSVV